MIGAAFFALAFVGVQQAVPAEPRPLRAVLTEVSRRADIYAVAVPLLAEDKVMGPKIDEVTKENVEATLLNLAKKLSIPARLVRLNLPRGQNWTAEEILAYARAEATLLKKTVGNLTKEGIEVIGQVIPPDKSGPVVEALNLRPTYVFIVGQAHFGGTWETTYGTMKLEQKGTRVTGTYSTNSGTITGDVKDNTLRFIWSETSGSGGNGTFVLSDDGTSFSGPWFTHGQTEQSGVWTGRRGTADPTPP